MRWFAAGSRGPRPIRADSGLLVAAGSVVTVVGCFAVAGIPAHLAGPRLAVLAVVVGCFTVVAGDLIAALGTALVGWLLFNGFLVDRYGELHWHGGADAVRLGVLGTAAVAGTVLGMLARRRSRPAVVVLIPAPPAATPVRPAFRAYRVPQSGAGQLPRMGDRELHG